MLSTSTGLFRAACLQAHAHPLQCRALELCFNVALNRLPTLTTSGPMLSPVSAHNHYPTIANALIAAFKRAQAHQRRGSIENQQQPLLALKIELGQLVISILDDPSVSRVMKEAGFSSTLVKSKVEQAISMELGSQNQSHNDNTKPKEINNSNNNSSDKMVKSRPLDEDVKSVIDSLMSKRNKRNSVVVGECIEMLESLIREVKVRVEKSDHEDLNDVKFVHFGLSNFGNLCKEEVEQKVMELKCLVKSCVENNKGVILYLDDLKWVNAMKGISNNILSDQYQPRCFYCPIQHMVMEIGKLVLGYSQCGKFWLFGIATFQTYMRCKSGQPSLESILGLQAITFPNDSLGLSLIPESDLASPLTTKKGDNIGSSWLMLEGSGGEVNMEVQSLPSWLQKHKDEYNKRSTNFSSDKDSVPVKDLWKKWSSYCTLSTHASPTLLSSSPTFERSLSFSSISPSSSTSSFSYDQHHLKLKTSHQSIEPKNHWVSEPTSKANNEPANFTLNIQHNHNKEHLQQKHSPYISSNTCLTPTSTSSVDIIDQIDPLCSTPKFNLYNIESLKLISNALEQKIPRQKEIMMDIATTILQCRSRMTSRKGHSNLSKEETWLFFQGVDFDAKEKIARELANVIFGSQDKFVTIALSSFSSTRAMDSLEDCRNKRLRDEQSCSYIERFAKEISSDPHRVFFIEDIDQVDYSSLIGIKKAIERGTIPKYSTKEDVTFGDAIIILSCENFRSRSRACSPSTKHKQEISPREVDQKTIILGDGVPLEETISPSISLDLNISINDDDDDVCVVNYGESMDEIGLLSTIDKCIVFKNHNSDNHEIEGQ